MPPGGLRSDGASAWAALKSEDAAIGELVDSRQVIPYPGADTTWRPGRGPRVRYPAWMAGRWDVEATMVAGPKDMHVVPSLDPSRYGVPTGYTSIPLICPVVDMVRPLFIPSRYRARFNVDEAAGDCVVDRRYNAEKQLRGQLRGGAAEVYSVSVNESADPDAWNLFYGVGFSGGDVITITDSWLVDIYVSGATSSSPTPTTFETLEVVRQTSRDDHKEFLSPPARSYYSSDAVVVTRYEAVDDSRFNATQRVSVYSSSPAIPIDQGFEADGDMFGDAPAVGAQPIANYVLRLTASRAKEPSNWLQALVDDL